MTNNFNNFNSSTLVDLLRYRAIHQPNQKAFTFLRDGETESGSLSYEQLDRQARAIAASLQSLGVTGERALLLYPSGLEFIAAFFGCLYAGVIAVPAYPPRKKQEKLSRLKAIAENAQAKIALTTELLLPNIKSQLAQNLEMTDLQSVATDNTAIDLASNWQEPEITNETLAFLQYTSGSTGTPKGVMVSHGNILYNEQMLKMGFHNTEKTIFVTWSPLFHDMGLIANMLQSPYSGIPCILMPPEAFIQKPVRWLQAISRYRATTSGAPNFAYELCIQKITSEERKNLDLSSWEVAFSGAEPIRAETLERFTTTFESCGFRAQSFYPCYGMAETTVFVSGGLKTALPVVCQVDEAALEQNTVVVLEKEQKNVRKIVGCGQTWLNQKIMIVNPESLTQCRADRVGEIWISGANVAKGYWYNSEQTKQTFQAYLADTGEGPFLRTGDLGFLKDGELFVTGRLKDMMIIRGRNHYPQDIEITVQKSHPALRPDCGAAFAVDIEGESRLIVAQEVERSYLRKLNVDEVVGAIRSSVSEQHDLQLYAVLLLKTATIPKTSSGKIQRHACQKRFIEGSLELVGSWKVDNFATNQEHLRIVQPLSALKQQTLSLTRTTNHTQKSNNSKKRVDDLINWLTNWIEQKLGIAKESIDSAKPLNFYGLDSVTALSLTSELEDLLGLELPSDLAWDYPTISDIVGYLVPEVSSPVLSPKEDIVDSAAQPFEKAKTDFDKPFNGSGFSPTIHSSNDRKFLKRRVERFYRRVEKGNPIKGKIPGSGDIKLLTNDYLSLATHPAIGQAQAEVLLKNGNGLMTSGVYQAVQSPQRNFERQMAALIQTEDVVVCQSGYCANVGLIQSIADESTPVYIDLFAHASLWEGTRSAGATVRPFMHNDVVNLEKQLQKYGSGVIAVDSMYSTNGNICPLEQITLIAQKYECLLVVDESHSLGVYGDSGEGLVAKLGLASKVHFRTASLSKAFCGRGGIIAGSARNLEYFRYESRPAIFSTGVLSHEIAAFEKTLEIIQQDHWRREKLMKNSHYLRNHLSQMGYNVESSQSPIIALESGTEARTIILRDALESRGIFGAVFCAPATPLNGALVRFTVNCGLNLEQLDRVIEVCAEIRDEVNLEEWESVRRKQGMGSVMFSNLLKMA